MEHDTQKNLKKLHDDNDNKDAFIYIYMSVVFYPSTLKH